MFFLDAKNIFVVEYLSKILNRIDFAKIKFNMVYFKIVYKSKSINLFFMLKQRRIFKYNSNVFYSKLSRYGRLLVNYHLVDQYYLDVENPRKFFTYYKENYVTLSSLELLTLIYPN